MEEKILSTLRFMAWERAKGELNSLLHTYHSSLARNKEAYEQRKKMFDDVYDEVNKFIKLMEDEKGLG